MGSVTLDFRFSSINYELWALDRYLNIIERNLPDIVKDERSEILSIFEPVDPSPDDGEYITALQMSDEIESRILPRLFLAPFLISLWSVFESGILETSDYIAKQRGTKLRIADFKGSFLERTKKYFKDVIDYELCLGGTCWKDLRDFAEVRNAFAHSNGRISAIREPSARRIARIANQLEGLSIDGEFLLPSVSYVRSMFKLIFSILDDLTGRVMVGFSQ